MKQSRKNVWGIVAGVMVLLFCAACTTGPNVNPEGTPQPTATTVPAEQPGRAKELLDLLLIDQMNTTYSVYNFPSYYLDFVDSEFEYMDEMVQQEDYVEVLLSTYQEMKFIENRTIADTEENTAYKKEVREQADRIVLLEAMLATDEVFDRMSKEQKEQTLKAVQEKILARGNGKYNTGSENATMVNGFFAYIKQNEYTGSKWYEYIVNGENEAAKNFLGNACYPTDSIPVYGDQEEQIPSIVLTDVYKKNDEWAFSYDMTISAVSELELTGEIRSVKEVIVQQYENENPLSSVSPGFYLNTFETVEEAEKYIGLKRLQLPEWKYAVNSVEVSMNGTGEGNLEGVSLIAKYDAESVNGIQFMMSVYTEYYEAFSEEYNGKLSLWGYFYPETEEETMVRECFWYETTQSGVQALILRTANLNGDAYVIYADFVKDNIKYFLGVRYDKGEETEAEKILREFINQY